MADLLSSPAAAGPWLPQRGLTPCALGAVLQCPPHTHTHRIKHIHARPPHAYHTCTHVHTTHHIPYTCHTHTHQTYYTYHAYAYMRTYHKYVPNTHRPAPTRKYATRMYHTQHPGTLRRHGSAIHGVPFLFSFQCGAVGEPCPRSCQDSVSSSPV